MYQSPKQCCVCSTAKSLSWHANPKGLYCTTCYVELCNKDYSHHCKVPETVGLALKFDSGKPPMSLLPGRALREVAHVLAYGANLYGPHNWRQGFNWSRLADAAMRHLTSFNEGDRKDPDTSRSHLAHAACMVLFLLQHELEGLGTDDMFTRKETINVPKT